jgi:hypothetical protein
MLIQYAGFVTRQFVSLSCQPSTCTIQLEKKFKEHFLLARPTKWTEWLLCCWLDQQNGQSIEHVYEPLKLCLNRRLNLAFHYPSVFTFALHLPYICRAYSPHHTSKAIKHVLWNCCGTKQHDI